MEKYILLKQDYVDIIHPNDRYKKKIVRLYRIMATTEFVNPFIGTIKVGDVGGYVQSIGNLKHDCVAWISNTAKVFDDAVIDGSTLVSDKSMVFGKSTLTDCQVHDRAMIHGESKASRSSFSGKVTVYGTPVIEDCVLMNTSMIYGSPKTFNCVMSGGSMIHGSADVRDTIMSDVSEIRGDANVVGCKLSDRSILESGVHEQQTYAVDVNLQVVTGKGEL